MGKYRFDEIAVNNTEKKKPEKADKHTYIGLEHLDPGRLQVTRYGSDVAPIGEKLIMRKGDVLFGKRRAYQKKVAIAPFDGIFSAHGMVLRPNEKVIDRDFFPFFISSDYFLDAAIAISVGSLSPTINWRDLRELEFELPNLVKQRELAKILWAMEETKKSYRNLLQLSDKLVKSQFREMFGDPVNNRFGFPITTLNEVAAEPLSYGSVSSATDYDGNTRYIRITDINENGSLGDDLKSAMRNEDKYLLNEGDLLFARTGATVGKTCIYRKCYGRAIFAGFLIRLIPNTSIINPDYLFHFTKSDYYWDFVKSTQRVVAQPNINAQEYGGLQLLLPSKQTQNQFVALAQQSDKSKFELEQTLVALTRTTRKLLSQSFG